MSMCILCLSLGIGDFVRAARHCKESVNVVEGLFGSNSIELAHEMHKLAQLLFNRYVSGCVSKSVYVCQTRSTGGSCCFLYCVFSTLL